MAKYIPARESDARRRLTVLENGLRALQEEIEHVKKECGLNAQTCEDWLREDTHGLVSNVELLAVWDFDVLLNEAADLSNTPEAREKSFTYNDVIRGLVVLRAEMRDEAEIEFQDQWTAWQKRYG